jgi:hypothetical protein
MEIYLPRSNLNEYSSTPRVFIRARMMSTDGEIISDNHVSGKGNIQSVGRYVKVVILSISSIKLIFRKDMAFISIKRMQLTTQMSALAAVSVSLGFLGPQDSSTVR